MKSLKRWLKSVLQWLRLYWEDPTLLEIRRQAGNLEMYRALTQPWLQAYDIRTVIDIGANRGQFTIAAQFALPHATIHSIEPLPDCYQHLQMTTDSRRVRLHPVALGAEEGQQTFYANNYGPASSLRRITHTAIAHFPRTAQTTATTVNITTLDALFQDDALPPGILVKMDVQGYEDKVIQGGQHTLKQCDILILEINFEHIYEDQPTFAEIHDALTALGFAYRGNLDQSIDPASGAILFADGIFTRQPAQA